MKSPHARMPHPQAKQFLHAIQHEALLHKEIPPALNTLQASFGQQNPLKMVSFADGYHLPDHTTYEHLQSDWATIEDNSMFEFRLHVNTKTQPDQPLLLLHVATQHQARCYPLVKLTLEPHSRLQLFEYHTSILNPSYYYNSTLRIILQPHSELHHVRFIRNSREGQYKLTTQVYQHNNSSYHLHEISLSSVWRSSTTDVYLQQPHAQCDLQALDVGQRQQSSHHHMTVHHKAPHCSSRQLHKGLYAGSARGVFVGEAVVDKQAVHTKAHQLTRSLLLSPHAQAYSQPQLQIETDEVQCGHGAAVSQLDEQAVFYLQSRGIDRHCACRILTRAFTQEVLHTIKPVWLRNWVQERLQSTFGSMV